MGDVSARGGGGCLPGGVCLGVGVSDRCKNIIFLPLLLRAVTSICFNEKEISVIDISARKVLL